MNKNGQLDELNLGGIIGGVIGGFIGLIIASRMGSASIVIKGMSFLISGIACYFVASKIIDE